MYTYVSLLHLVHMYMYLYVGWPRCIQHWPSSPGFFTCWEIQQHSWLISGKFVTHRFAYMYTCTYKRVALISIWNTEHNVFHRYSNTITWKCTCTWQCHSMQETRRNNHVILAVAPVRLLEDGLFLGDSISTSRLSFKQRVATRIWVRLLLDRVRASGVPHEVCVGRAWQWFWSRHGGGRMRLSWMRKHATDCGLNNLFWLVSGLHRFATVLPHELRRAVGHQSFRMNVRTAKAHLL